MLCCCVCLGFLRAWPGPGILGSICLTLWTAHRARSGLKQCQIAWSEDDREFGYSQARVPRTIRGSAEDPGHRIARDAGGVWTVRGLADEQMQGSHPTVDRDHARVGLGLPVAARGVEGRSRRRPVPDPRATTGSWSGGPRSCSATPRERCLVTSTRSTPARRPAQSRGIRAHRRSGPPRRRLIIQAIRACRPAFSRSRNGRKPAGQWSFCGDHGPGHASLAFTVDRYGHLLPDGLPACLSSPGPGLRGEVA